MKLKFIEPMECLAVSKLPDGPQWVYEIKLDGYRAQAIRTVDGVAFYSRNGKSLAKKFPYIVEALHDLPADTIVDGELVALDASGRPEFNRLQNHAGAALHIRYFLFDVIMLKGRDLTGLPLSERRKLLPSLPSTNQRIVISEVFNVSAETMLAAVKAQGLEGVVAKRLDSLYESGMRTGAWVKMRVNQGQEFVIGGYTRGVNGIDAIVVGYYKGDDLIYVARTRNGFVPASRRSVFQRLRGLETEKCPFTNLPETRKARVGRGDDGRKDEGVCLGSAGTRGPNRFPRMDGCRPPSTLKIRRIARRQRPERRSKRNELTEIDPCSQFVSNFLHLHCKNRTEFSLRWRHPKIDRVR